MSPRRQLKPVPLPVVDTSGCAFDREKHAYTVEGVQIPSVTQILNEVGFVDFSHVPDRILEQAQARGTYVHTILHYLLENDFDLNDVDERFRGYIESALAYLELAKLRPLAHPETGEAIAVEYRFWDRDRRFAGTLDYLAWDAEDVLVINDWKTGEPSDVAAPLQLAAYEHGVRLTLFPDHRFPIRRRAIKLFKDGKPGRVEPYGPENGHAYVQDIGTFFSALNCIHYRRNGMRHSAA